MKDIADFAEPRLFLERHPDIRYVDALYVDICGRPRGKRCPVDKLASLYAEGVQSPQSHFLLDTNGDSSDPVGRGFSDGDPDTTLYPVPGSLAAVPWASEPLAQLLIGERGGEREGFPVDPRQILAAAVRPLAELGLKPVMAVELEFYLFELEPDSRRAARASRPPPSAAGGPPPAPTASRSWKRSAGSWGRSRASAGCSRSRPRSSPRRWRPASSRSICIMWISRWPPATMPSCCAGSSRRRPGATPCARASWPSPFSMRRAAACMSMSALSTIAAGICSMTAPPPAALMLRQAIGGLHQAMPESQAIFAPSLNAFRRFGPGQFVPLNRFWGYNNRAVAFRVPTGPSAARRIEHRIAGADANPYLVLAAILAGIHHGIATSADPGEPRQGNVVLEDPGISFDLSTALDRLAQERVARPLYRSGLSPGLCRGEARRARPLPRRYRAARIRLVSVRIHA